MVTKFPLVEMSIVLGIGMLEEGCYHPSFREADNDSQTLIEVAETKGFSATGGNTSLATSSGEEGSSSGGILEACGDQKIDPGEICDDGNLIPYDGCEPNCQPTPSGVIATGYYHSCALVGNGAIRCWGDGHYGQLGYGNIDDDACPGLSCASPECCIGDSEAPSSAGPVVLENEAIQIAAGPAHTCAIVAGGDVYCWGSGNSGRLGYGNPDDLGKTMETLPGSTGAVSVGSPAVQIVAGAVHTCALLAGEEGKIRCWGYGESGRLGHGSTVNIGDSSDMLPSKQLPVNVGLPAIQVTAGLKHTCALLNDGSVRCWGYGEHGRLGYGNTGGIKCLNQVNSFACTQNDKDNVEDPKCCIGDTESPIFVVEPLNLGDKAIQIAAGHSHTCAIRRDGSVVCWGRNRYGELGYGDIGNNNECVQASCWEHTECCIGDDEHPASKGPVDLDGKAIQVTAGGNHTCALLEGGDVRCWGQGVWSQLGHGHTNNVGDDEVPSAEMPLKLGGKVIQIAAGEYHTCALLEGGDVRCWGYGNYGMLGNGNTGGNICKIDDNFSCEANSFCCIGDKLDEMPPPLVEFR